MHEVSIEKIMKKAAELKGAGKKWHFHMLTPDCTLNEDKRRHAFVLENETDSETLVEYSSKRRMAEGKKLVKMLHGNEILGSSDSRAEKGREFELMLKKAEELNRKGIHWHHHLLFPNCVFNRHNGKWCLIMEDRESGATIESLSKAEPKEKLKKIESLFYAQDS